MDNDTYVMLYLAAKAAAIPVIGRLDHCLLIRSNGCKTCYEWNPLEDDGDAFRLAVTLGIFELPGWIDDWTFLVRTSPEPYKATRRLIVRSAEKMV